MSKVARKSIEDIRLERGSRRANVAVEEARAAGWLDGDKDHVTFRVPRALVEQARQNSGVERKTDMGLAAFAMLAQRDPFAEFLIKTRGVLGPDHDLEL